MAVDPLPQQVRDCVGVRVPGGPGGQRPLYA